MSCTSWNDSWRIGIRELDNEHRVLSQLLGDIYTAVQENDASGRGGTLLHALTDRIRAHFSAEERMMAGDKYPGAVLHALKHEHLINQLHALMARVDQTPSNLNEHRHALKFLREWFQTHIVHEDKAFGVWLNEHGKY